MSNDPVPDSEPAVVQAGGEGGREDGLGANHRVSMASPGRVAPDSWAGYQRYL